MIGPTESGVPATRIYIGETDDLPGRLDSHSKNKDFWNRVIVFTSKDANLTKGHIKYLESRLISLAKEADRSELLNGTDPEYDGLPEADRSDMEFFLEQIQTLLPVLGFDFLRLRPRITPVAENAFTPVASSPTSPVFVGDVKKHGITARGQEIDGEFVVFKGSTARRTWEGAERYDSG